MSGDSRNNFNANNADYVKSVVFLKERAVVKLLEILPFISMKTNNDIKIVFLQILPVVFSHVELTGQWIEKALELIKYIKHHPMFSSERSMFDGWHARLRNQLPVELNGNGNKEIKIESNKFVNIPGTEFYDIIGYSELDLFSRYHKWLKHHKLHKYLYFFANLSFNEIQSIDSRESIQALEDKINLHKMTTGARNAIVKKLSELNKRANRLETFCSNEYFISVIILENCNGETKTEKYINVLKVEKCIDELKSILKTPVKKDLFGRENDLPLLIKKSIESVISVALKLKRKQEFVRICNSALSLLKMAWGCYFFLEDAKTEFNYYQTNLHLKLRSFARKNRHGVSKKIDTTQFYKFDQKVVQLDIEKGIRAITWYLENVILIEK